MPHPVVSLPSPAPAPRLETLVGDAQQAEFERDLIRERPGRV
jgi:hypothetical protein